MEQKEMLMAWKELQSRVEKITALQIESQGKVRQSEMRAVQNRTRLSPVNNLIAAGVSCLVTGGFIADHFTTVIEAPVSALPAVNIIAFSILLTNLSVRQLILSYQLDYASPIVETQTQLAKLRKLRLQSTQLVFVLALPTWFIFPILFGQMAFGVRFINAISPTWILANIAFGIAMIPVLDWVLKRSRYADSLQDMIVGKNIVEAESFLRELSEFKAG